MADLAVGDVVQCRFNYAGPTGEEAFNILYFVVQTITGGTVSDQQFADWISPMWGSAIPNIMPSTCSYDGVQVSIPTRSPMPATVVSRIGAAPGTVGAQVGNTQATALVSYYTSLAGRDKRGRSYLPYISSSWIASNGFPSTAFNTLLATIAAFISSLFGFTVGGASILFAQVVFHRKLKLWTFVFTWIARPKFASQRRRGNYGRNRNPPL